MKYITPIKTVEKQLKKVLDNLDSKWVRVSFILSGIDSPINFDLKRMKFSPESFIKLYLLKRIKKIIRYSSLIKSLNSEDIFNLGLTEGIPKKRTFNEFLQKRLTKEDINFLDEVARKIFVMVTKEGIILDIEIKNKNGKSTNRNKAFKEAVKLVKKLVYPQIDIKIKNNGKFTTKDLLDVLVHVAYSHDFANNGSMTFSYQNNIDSPSGDLMMYHFNKIKSVEEVKEMFEKVLDIILNFAKKEYNILKRRKLDIAYDIHKIPYYGKPNNFIRNGKYERGTTSFLEFLTCDIVVAGRRFTIDVLPISSLDELEDLMDESLARVKKKIRIDKVLVDRGFDSSYIVNLFRKHNLKFLMPKVRTYTVKSYFDKSEDCKARIIKDFRIGTGKNKATANLVLVNDKDGVKRAFLTNLDIPIQLTHYLYQIYSKRWGIETGYRQKDKDFLARTTSNNYIIRLFYFLFSVCLYNLWVLVNICVSLMIYGRIKEKPIISAKLFAVILYKIQIEDPGG